MPSAKETTFVASTTSDVDSGVAPSIENSPSPSGHASPRSAFEKSPGTSTLCDHSQMSETRRMFSKRLCAESNVFAMKVSVRCLSK